MTTPRATVRLQFHAGFRIDDAIPLVDYFARLGVSHVYASPLAEARAGSMHGYDTIDYGRISPELGGEDALRRLVARLREAGMGLILDIVPNHMAATTTNPWWRDVLEWGRNSQYASYFDIDWEVPDPRLRGKVLAPFLGAPYGEELKSANLRLVFDADSGCFEIAYHDSRFPVNPLSFDGILASVPQTAQIVALRRAFEALEQSSAPHHRTRACELLAQAARTGGEVGQAIDRALAAHDAQFPSGRERLHRLLERQHYRLAWWRTAAEEMNWRRFFEISDLVGIRIDQQEVFDAVHGLVLRLYGEGLIDGVRIDHIDGLTDPQKYCLNLRASLGAAAERRPPGLGESQAYIVVEKILAGEETLDAQWRVDGTTGYDFMTEVGAVLHDERGEAALTRLWQAVSDDARDLPAIATEARRMLIERHFAGEFENLCRALWRIAQLDVSTRDWALPAVRRVVMELLVAFPVYRTYSGIRGRTAADEAVFARSMARARDALQADDQRLLELIDGWLGGEAPYNLPPGPARDARLDAVRRFQQLTAPLAAKSVEDTGFFRYGRLLSRNEVGAEPQDFAWDAARFHEAQARRAAHQPASMLATATHDHKRGEDARARLAVLSEVPEAWAAAVEGWLVRGPDAPHPVDQYMLLQTLVAAWPLEPQARGSAGIAELRERIAAWQVKSLREGKLRSTWFAPDTDYEALCERFLDERLTGGLAGAFVPALSAFVDAIAPAGALNGLAEALLRMTVPGVPDLYQGTERWDFSLTDPDNRRPVDFAVRRAAQAAPADDQTLLAEWRDGRIKQALVERTLGFRARHAALFAEGEYVPLALEGACAAHAIAFARRRGEEAAIVIAPRLAASLPGSGEGQPLERPHVPPERWGDTAVVLPDGLAGRDLVPALAGAALRGADGRLPLREALAAFPVGLWGAG